MAEPKEGVDVLAEMLAAQAGQLHEYREGEAAPPVFNAENWRTFYPYATFQKAAGELIKGLHAHGIRLVPTKPTEEMRDDFWSGFERPAKTSRQVFVNAYRAMVDAAPGAKEEGS